MAKTHDFFMDLDLPIYGKVGIIDGKGIHYFSALNKTQGDTSKFLKYLVLELLVVEGEFVTEEYLDNMCLKDVSYLITVVGEMMGNNFKL